jgi:hypothetical protein
MQPTVQERRVQVCRQQINGGNPRAVLNDENWNYCKDQERFSPKRSQREFGRHQDGYQ